MELDDDPLRMPFPALVLDEIGLEGLEGITIPSLWVYLSRELKCNDLPERIKTEAWSIIKRGHKNIRFYELPAERETVKLWDRYGNVDPLFGVPIVRDVNEEPRNRFTLLDKFEIFGSSESYTVRKKIKFSQIANLSLDAVMKTWGKKLIMVGTQKLRWKSLVPENSFVPDDLTTFQYAVLEAVGRSRYNGETSCGPYSLLQFCNDSSLLFYVKNKLASLNLIITQTYSEKQNDRITPCYLLVLTKFYRPFKSHIMEVMETLVDAIRQSDELQLPIAQFRRLLSAEHNKIFKKINNLPIFRQFFYIEQPLTPKVTKTEKAGLMVSLRNPETEPDEVYVLEEEGDDESEDEEDMNGEANFNTNSLAYANMSDIEEYLNCIQSFGPQGCSHAELCRALGIAHLTVRSVVKTLMDEGYVKTYSVDIGRQRVNMYVTVDNDEEAQRLKDETEEVLHIKCKDEPNIPVLSDELMSDCEMVHGVIKPHIVDADLQTKDAFTHRMITRKTFVIDAIDEKCLIQVVDLRLALQKSEKANGCTDELCLKSIWRLLYNMQSNKLINLYDIFLKYKNAIRTYRYVTHPKISADHPVLQHELLKLKNALYVIFEEKKSNQCLKDDVGSLLLSSNCKSKATKAFNLEGGTSSGSTKPNEPTAQLSESHLKNEVDEERKMKIHSKPIKFPKLLISRYMHELLHYIVYDLEQDRKPINISRDLLYEWQRSEPNLQVNKYFEEWEGDENHPMIYRKDINWRTFIPPMPRYAGKPKGWINFLDVMKRIPLSLLNKIFRIEKEANEKVLEFLMHPVKQHYMLKQVPHHLHGYLVTRLEMQKIYIMCLKLLQHMGLIQIAIRNYIRDPLVMWVYVNRYATILNTTTSEQGYDCVSTDREYEAKRYDFYNTEQVTSYWQDLHRICVYTKLGFKKSKKNRAPPSKKKELTYLDGVSFEDAPSKDLGLIPGNGLGAAGLNSTLYSHALRHWSWLIQSDLQSLKQVRPARIPVVRSKPKISLNARRSRTVMPQKNQKRKTVLSLPSTKITSAAAKAVSARKSGPRDAIDRDALNNMRCLRVKWAKREDELIKLARAVYLYIAAPVPALGLLTVGKAVRDILRHSLGIKNKTQQACVRRSQFIIKMHRDVPEVTTWLHILQTNPYIQYKYGEDFLKRLKHEYPDRKAYCDALAIHFIFIAKILYQIVYQNNPPDCTSSILHNFQLPDTMHEFKVRFRERIPLTDEPLVTHRNPASEHDQHVAVVHGVLHSTLCCARDKTLYSLQAFEIYKNYSEVVLQEAFTKARNDSLAIAIKRKNLQLSPTQLAGPAYLLSSKYRMRLVYLKFPYGIYEFFFQFFAKTVRDYFAPKTTKARDYFELKSPQIGQLFLIAEGLTKDFLTPSVKFPVNILNIDAEYKEKCTHMDRIMDHYSSIFANAPTTEYYKNIETETSDATSLVQFHPAFLTYKVKYSPFDLISKMSDYLVHFFCALSNLNKTFVLDIMHLQHIDEETQAVLITCPFENCVMKCSTAHQYMNTIDRIVHVKKLCLEALRKDQGSIKAFKFSSEPMNVVLSPYNLLSFVRALENHWQNVSKETNRKDFGKLTNPAMRKESEIKWLEMCHDILHYKKNEENDFCDEYEPKLSKDEKSIRAQDILVVNLPKLQFKMSAKWSQANNETANYQGVKVPVKLIETDVTREKILKEIINESTWKYTENTLETLKEEESFTKLSESEKALLSDVYEFLEVNKLGISSIELMAKYSNHSELENVLLVLAEHYLIKRVGVATFMYAHKNYIRPWVIHTFHVKRLEKEKLGSAQESLSKRKASEITEEVQKQVDSSEPTTKKVRFEENEAATSESSKRVRKPTQHYGWDGDKSSTSKSKENQRNTIVMKPRPWLRLNGSLNRRVLDRWLGAILTECIAKSGRCLLDISNRFPQVLPVDVYYLVEILVALKCVRLTQMVYHEPSLTSHYHHIQEKPVSTLYDPAHTYVVATADAISRMSIFIGQKKYDVEFI